MSRQIKYKPCAECGKPIYAHCWDCHPYIKSVPPAYVEPIYNLQELESRQNPSTPQLEVSSSEAIILVYIAGHYLQNARACDILVRTMSENAKTVADKLIRSILS